MVNNMIVDAEGEDPARAAREIERDPHVLGHLPAHPRAFAQRRPDPVIEVNENGTGSIPADPRRDGPVVTGRHRNAWSGSISWRATSANERP
jgi:hypothetical protein